MTNLQVEIVDEATFVVEGHNEPMTLQEYVNYTQKKVVDLTGPWEKLLAAWQQLEAREAIYACWIRKCMSGKSWNPNKLGGATVAVL